MGQSLGTGFRVWPDLEVEPDLIDAPIRPLVAALNRTTWARTVFSCAGHPEEPESVAKGRRQAHVDVLVRDEHRWRAFTSAARRAARSAAGRTAGGAAGGVRVTEGSLGPVPGWLSRLDSSAPPRDPEPGEGSAPPARGDPPSRRWHYRRLVLEPVPYDLPADACRRVLDAAITAAVRALEQSPG